MFVRVLLGIGIVATVIALIREVESWRAGTRSLTRRQRGLRVAMAALMVAILAMILAGPPWTPGDNPAAALGYWMACIGLAFLLVVLALMDMREIGRAYLKERRDSLHGMAKRDDESRGSDDQSS